MYVRILVDKQWCVDPACGPIIDLKKSKLGDAEYLDEKLAKELIAVGYAELFVKKKVVEKTIEKPVKKSKPKKVKKDIVSNITPRYMVDDENKRI